MSELSDYRITDEDVAQNGVIAAPDRLTGSAAQNKAVFDRLIRDAVKEKFNGLLAAVEASSVWEPYDAERTYVPGNKVVYKGSSYLCTKECTGEVPTNTENFRSIAERGADGTGAGDMRASDYDGDGEVKRDGGISPHVEKKVLETAFTKEETLSVETAQEFADAGISETAPQTPNEAFADMLRTVVGVPVLTTEIITETTTWVAPRIKGDVHVRLFGAGGAGGGSGGTSGVGGGGGGGGGHMETLVFTPAIGQAYLVTIGDGGLGSDSGPGGSGGATSFGNLITATGGSGGIHGSSNNGLSGSGGDGGSGGGGGDSYYSNGGDGAYGGGGGAGRNYRGRSSGGNGGAYGGGGGAGCRGGEYGSVGGVGGDYGGDGGAINGNGSAGTDTSEMELDFVGKGTGGSGGANSGGGGGGYGGNGGNGGTDGVIGGGGGGGGYGGDGGDGGNGGGGGGGGYGANGGSGGYAGGGGGGYGIDGTGGSGSYGGDGGKGGYAAGGGGGFMNSDTRTAVGGRGGNGIVILTYWKYVIGG